MNKTNFISDNSVYQAHQNSTNKVKGVSFGDFPTVREDKFYQTFYCTSLSVNPGCMLFYNEMFVQC